MKTNWIKNEKVIQFFNYKWDPRQDLKNRLSKSHREDASMDGFVDEEMNRLLDIVASETVDEIKTKIEEQIEVYRRFAQKPDRREGAVDRYLLRISELEDVIELIESNEETK